MRDFSNRYVTRSAPTSQLRLSKWMRVNLPKRDELWFITVFALPKASRIGLQLSTFSARLVSTSDARFSSAPRPDGSPHMAR